MQKVAVLAAHVDAVPEVDSAVLFYACSNQLAGILTRLAYRRFKIGQLFSVRIRCIQIIL